MRYTTLGRRTGLRVSEYALGTAHFGTRWPTGADADESRAIFDRFADAGGTFLDTADVYQYGESETLLGGFLAGRREEFLLASKFTQGSTAGAGVMHTGNSRKAMVQALEASLRRLGTDYVDLYWVHWPDFVTPVAEIVSAFDDLVRAGKILHGGLSNFPAWRVARAATLGELRGTSSVVATQFEYSLAVRDGERDLLPMAEALGLGALLYSPLGGGLLTGKYRQGGTAARQSAIQREDTAQKSAVLDVVLDVAEEVGVPPLQVAMAWVRERARRASTTVLPIIGPRTTDQLAGYLGALAVELPEGQYDRLDVVSAPLLGVPHEGGAASLDAVLGGRQEAFDRPGPVA